MSVPFAIGEMHKMDKESLNILFYMSVVKTV